jgi:hypothetical protein
MHYSDCQSRQQTCSMLSYTLHCQAVHGTNTTKPIKIAKSPHACGSCLLLPFGGPNQIAQSVCLQPRSLQSEVCRLRPANQPLSNEVSCRTEDIAHSCFYEVQLTRPQSAVHTLPASQSGHKSLTLDTIAYLNSNSHDARCSDGRRVATLGFACWILVAVDAKRHAAGRCSPLLVAALKQPAG